MSLREPNTNHTKSPIASPSLSSPLILPTHPPRPGIRCGGRAESHDRETENIPGIVLRPQAVVVEGSEGGFGRWGGEVNKIKKAIMRPQHKPYNYVPKFNQNSFPHWAVRSSQAPLPCSAPQDRPLRCHGAQSLFAAQRGAGSDGQQHSPQPAQPQSLLPSQACGA